MWTKENCGHCDRCRRRDLSDLTGETSASAEPLIAAVIARGDPYDQSSLNRRVHRMRASNILSSPSTYDISARPVPGNCFRPFDVDDCNDNRLLAGSASIPSMDYRSSGRCLFAVCRCPHRDTCKRGLRDPCLCVEHGGSGLRPPRLGRDLRAFIRSVVESRFGRL